MRVSGLCFLAGCQVVFPLEEPRTCEPSLAAVDDEDRDGVANGDDLCPRIANESPHDEDGDGVPDACDVCPIFEDLGQRDEDCDLVGDPCDPNPGPANQIEFMSFANDLAIRYDQNAVVVDDVLRIQILTGGFGAAYVREPHPTTGRYELDFAIDSWGDGLDFDAGLRLNNVADTDSRLAVIVRSGATGNEFAIRSVTQMPEDLAAIALPPLSGRISFHLRVDLDGPAIHAELSGAATATLDGTVTLGPMIEHGFQAHDINNTGVIAEAAYLARITTR